MVFWLFFLLESRRRGPTRVWGSCRRVRIDRMVVKDLIAAKFAVSDALLVAGPCRAFSNPDLCQTRQLGHSLRQHGPSRGQVPHLVQYLRPLSVPSSRCSPCSCHGYPSRDRDHERHQGQWQNQVEEPASSAEGQAEEGGGEDGQGMSCSVSCRHSSGITRTLGGDKRQGQWHA